MKNIFNKKKSDVDPFAPNEVNNTSAASGLGVSHQKFLGRFSKKNPATTSSPAEMPTYAASANPRFAKRPNLQKDTTNDVPVFDIDALDRLHSQSTTGQSNAMGNPPIHPDTASDRITAGIPKQARQGGLPSWLAVGGRIGRVQFLAYSTIWMIFALLLALIIIFALRDVLSQPPDAEFSFGLIPRLAAILFLPIYIYAAIFLPRRRLHDIGRSGWWILLSFLPIANIVYLYWVLFKAGDTTVNRYGEPPARYNGIEMILASLLPVLVVGSMVLLPMLMSPFTDRIALEANEEMNSVILDPVGATPQENTPMTTDQIVVEAATPTQIPVEAATNGQPAPETGAASGSTLNEMATNAPVDPMLANNPEIGTPPPNANQAQIDSALQNTIQVEPAPAPASNGPISYDEFMQEANTTIMVE